MTRQDLEHRLAAVLSALLSRAPWLRRWTVELAPRHRTNLKWDLVASGRLAGGEKAALCVECKQYFQPSQFSSLVDRPCRVRRLKNVSRALAMPHVSPRMAALCEQHGWSWFDLAGNCRLEIPGALLIERSGREPVHHVSQPSGANLSTPEAGRVARALLAPENASRRWTQRELVAHFGELSVPVPPPSLALVNKVVQHLRSQAFIEPLPNRGFRVRDPEGLLHAWSQAYRSFENARRRRYFTLLQGRALHDALRSLSPSGKSRVAYAAFSAADFQAPHVRQPRTWLYLAGDLEEQFMKQAEAKPVDSGENLVVLVPPDFGVFYRLEVAANRLACTNAVQTYVDLMHAGGRGEEAAGAVLQQRLKPAWSGI